MSNQVKYAALFLSIAGICCGNNNNDKEKAHKLADHQHNKDCEQHKGNNHKKPQNDGSEKIEEDSTALNNAKCGKHHQHSENCKHKNNKNDDSGEPSETK